MTDVSSVLTSKHAPSFNEGALLIPIFAGNQFLAKAVLPSAALIDEEDSETVADLVRMVLEPLITQWMNGQQIRIIDSSSKENVISLFGHELAPQRPVVRSLLTPVIFLQSRNPHLLPRVIAEIHELSGRWARVDMEEIQHSITCVQDIRSLGAMTLVVNDLLNLDPAKIALVCEFVRSRPTEEMPLVLVSASTSLKDLIEFKILTAETASLLSQCILEVDRLPHRADLLRETLELFLEPGSIL